MDAETRTKYTQTIGALYRAFDSLGEKGVIIGGVAAGLLSIPRFTKDVDAMVMSDLSDLDSLLSALRNEGFEPLFSDAVEFAKRSRILPLSHTANGTTVDIALSCMPFEQETIDRSTLHTAEGIAFRLPTAEDLIVLKAIANREIDQEDIRRIAQVNPNLDKSRVKYWIEQYAELLESPDLWSQIKPLLKPE